MGVPVSPSGQNSLDIRTNLPPLNQKNCEGQDSFFSALWIFSPAWSSAHTPRRAGERESAHHIG